MKPLRCVNRYISLAICFTAMSGCAQHSIQKGFTHIGYRGALGIDAEPSNDGIAIIAVGPKSAADRAGIKPNDIIVEFEGLQLNNKENRAKTWRTIRNSPDVTFGLTLKRGLQKKSLRIETDKIPLYAETQVHDAIRDRFFIQEKKVAIAILIENVRNMMPMQSNESYSSRREWSDVISTSLTNDIESSFLSNFGNISLFSIVDRNYVEKIMEEQKFQISGAVDASTAKRLGALIGATHLLLVNFARMPEGNTSYNDVTQMRLIDVEDGTVAASCQRSDIRTF